MQSFHCHVGARVAWFIIIATEREWECVATDFIYMSASYADDVEELYKNLLTCIKLGITTIDLSDVRGCALLALACVAPLPWRAWMGRLCLIWILNPPTTTGLWLVPRRAREVQRHLRQSPQGTRAYTNPHTHTRPDSLVFPSRTDACMHAWVLIRRPSDHHPISLTLVPKPTTPSDPTTAGAAAAVGAGGQVRHPPQWRLPHRPLQG